MKPLLPVAAILFCASLSMAACSGGGIHKMTAADHEATTSSPGTRSAAYLPPSPNNAGTGNHDANTPLAVVGGQVPDTSNPTPPGLPSASPALN